MASSPSDASHHNWTVEHDLMLLGKTRNYRWWLWEKVSPHLGRRVLEIGAGIGNYSEYLVDREYCLVSDYDPKYVEMLSRRWAKSKHVEIMLLDVADVSEQQIAFVSERRIDTVVCLNVLEHVEDDERAVARLGRCLIPGGRLVLINPAHRFLYSALDATYGHVRRYERSDAARLARAAGLTVEKTEHFNLVGVAGWWWNHRLFRRKTLPDRQTLAFDRFVPLARKLDPIGFGRLGLSLLVVLKRRES
jgi:2-polyprenyl-3-methyl-5-hydroxy-6-metoxy-1,4-benzoquinol methylase